MATDTLSEPGDGQQASESRDGRGAADHDVDYAFGRTVSAYLVWLAESRLARLRSREDVETRRWFIRGLAPLADPLRQPPAPAPQPAPGYCSRCARDNVIHPTVEDCRAAARAYTAQQQAQRAPQPPAAPDFPELPF
jgi:hypothetical protein